MSAIEQLIEKYDIPIVKIDPDRGYWLIRTQAGEYFDEFHLGGFIGVGWNEFHEAEDFKENRKEITTEKIESIIEDTQAWRVFTQLKRFFHEIKIGDIVMIPSVNSQYIVFGEVTSDVYFEEITDEMLEEETCPYSKRRKVKWIKTVERKSLDPYLYRMMQSHFSISNAKDYADAIDRTLHSFYYKGDRSHLILNVNQKEDIPLIELLNALQAPLELVDVIKEADDDFKDFDKRDIDAKLRVQSPGIIELVTSGNAFGLVIILGVVMVSVVGGNLSFKRKSATGNETEGTLQSEGLIEKLIKWRKVSSEIRIEEKLTENRDPLMDKLTEAQEKLMHAKDTLRMELPKELTGQDNQPKENAGFSADSAEEK